MPAFQVRINGRNVLLSDGLSAKPVLVSSDICLRAATAEEARTQALLAFQQHPELRGRILNAPEDPPLLFASVEEVPDALAPESIFSPLRIEAEPDLDLAADLFDLLEEF